MTSVESISDTLKNIEVTNNNIKAMSYNAQKVAKQYFDWDVTAKNTVEKYKEIIY